MGNYASSCMAVRMKVEEEDTIEKPLRAGRIMQKFPDHLVCHSESLYIGQKTPALSPNDILEEGSKYFLLPDFFFQSELTIVLLASLISKSPCTPNGRRVSTSLRYIKRASALCQPFEIEKSDVGGSVRIRVSVEFMKKLVEEYWRRNVAGERRHEVGGASADAKRRLCNTPQLVKDYERLVMFRGRCWRPKLETIMENDQKIKKDNFQKLIFKTILICSIIDRPGSAMRYTLPLVATDHVNYLWYTMEFNWTRVVPGKTSYHTRNTTTVAAAGNG